MRGMLLLAGMVALFGRSTLAQPNSDARQFSGYIQSRYTAAEQRCINEDDADAGWCFDAAYKRRDAIIAHMVRRSSDQVGRQYQAAWLKYRAARCGALGIGGSGEATIQGECMLDMAIARQLELESTDEGSF